MRFDDDDGLDEEADFELQTRLSDTFGHLFAVVLLAETTPVPFALRCPWWCPRQSMEESAREDDMMTTMIRVRTNAAVVCAVVLRLKTFIQNPTNKKKKFGVRLTY